jgi:hypothetical protein
LQTLFNELSGQTDLRVAILGVNHFSYPPAGSTPPLALVSGRTLPWMRPHSAATDPAPSWQATYRDVVILDRYNDRRAVFNLTTYPIDGPMNPNRETLKQLLIGIATHTDADGDKLPDDWEIAQLGNLDLTPASVLPNGESVLMTYAFCQRTGVLDGTAQPECRIEPNGAGDFLTLRFRRRLGLAGGLTYRVEKTVDFLTWTDAGSDLTAIGPPVPNYDGTGTELVALRLLQPVDGFSSRFLRIRPSLPE